jgi:hypothetical protein
MDVSTGVAELKNDPTITDWLTASGTIGTLIGAVGIGAISLYLTRRDEQRQSQRQRRGEHMQRLAEIFKLVDDNRHRNARRRNYNLYLKENLVE